MFGFDLENGKLNTRKLSPGSYETIPDILKAIASTSHEVKKFEEHYANQSCSGIPHYEGILFPRGYGLLGVFRRLFRAALPFLVRGGKVVVKEALVRGTKVINDVLSGKDLQTAEVKKLVKV
ncbi:uncharacterized protein F54H12.2 [Caerostris darwini]|uniref:Uncharacterized protein F54H12.2 n=1 Tax=Caerostris darwini TaxID=1538125 RepID=A0AAV4QRI5_9ARAC|nr:uncharacterized protein F54H12.2 [Caerostris darwini]